MTRSILDAADQERARRKDDEASAWRTADEAFEELRVTALRVKRERDELLAALKLCADTFADFNKGQRLLNRPLLADACEIAEKNTRAAIAKAEGKS